MPAAIFGAVPALAVPATKGKPNILFVICDQFRADAIAALGNSHLKTPNIDRLVRRGVAFPKAYATTPECVPSRYTIITGREAPKTGFYNNALAPEIAAGLLNMLSEDEVLDLLAFMRSQPAPPMPSASATGPR